MYRYLNYIVSQQVRVSKYLQSNKTLQFHFIEMNQGCWGYELKDVCSQSDDLYLLVFKEVAYEAK